MLKFIKKILHLSLISDRLRSGQKCEDESPEDPRRGVGQTGERLAERYLKRQGMKLAERNLRRKAGEIDLLMIDGEELVIVEVRTIQEEGEGALEERVPYRKRRQLVRLANLLISEMPDPLPSVRFDVCVVVMEPEPKVNHYEDAFRVEELFRKHY